MHPDTYAMMLMFGPVVALALIVGLACVVAESIGRRHGRR